MGDHFKHTSRTVLLLEVRKVILSHTDVTCCYIFFYFFLLRYLDGVIIHSVLQVRLRTINRNNPNWTNWYVVDIVFIHI